MLSRQYATVHRPQAHIYRLPHLLLNIPHPPPVSQQRRTVAKIAIPRAMRKDEVSTMLREVAVELGFLKKDIHVKLERMGFRAQKGMSSDFDQKAMLRNIRATIKSCEMKVSEFRDTYDKARQSHKSKEEYQARFSEAEWRLNQQRKEDEAILSVLGAPAYDEKKIIASLIASARGIQNTLQDVVDVSRRRDTLVPGETHRASRWEVLGIWRKFVRCMVMIGSDPNEVWDVVTAKNIPKSEDPELQEIDKAKNRDVHDEWKWRKMGKIKRDAKGGPGWLSNRLKKGEKIIEDLERARMEELEEKQANGELGFRPVYPFYLQQENQSAESESQNSPHIPTNEESKEKFSMLSQGPSEGTSTEPESQNSPYIQPNKGSEEKPIVLWRGPSEGTSRTKDDKVSSSGGGFAPSDFPLRKYNSTPSLVRHVEGESRKQQSQEQNQDAEGQFHRKNSISNQESRNSPMYNSTRAEKRADYNKSKERPPPYESPRKDLRPRGNINPKFDRGSPPYESAKKDLRPRGNINPKFDRRPPPYESTRNDSRQRGNTNPKFDRDRRRGDSDGFGVVREDEEYRVRIPMGRKNQKPKNRWLGRGKTKDRVR